MCRISYPFFRKEKRKEKYANGNVSQTIMHALNQSIDWLKTWIFISDLISVIYDSWHWSLLLLCGKSIGLKNRNLEDKKWNTIFCFLDVCHHYQLMKFVKHKWNPLTQMIKMIMTLHFGQSINKRNEESNYNPNMDQGLNVNSRVTTITSNNSNENIYSGNKWKKIW